MRNRLSEGDVTIRTAIEADLGLAKKIARSGLDLDTEDAADVPKYLWNEESGTERVRLFGLLDKTAVGLAIGSIQGQEAFLDLIIVVPEARRRGLGNYLLRAWEEAATVRGVKRLRVGENLRAYAWPGVDIRYTPAVCLFLGSGYERTRVVYNMDLALHERLGPDARQLDGMAKAGVTVRRAEQSDREMLSAYVGTHWSRVWQREILLSIERYPATAFVALRGRAVVGFAAHGVYRPSLYGPIATDPSEQGAGIGSVLSRLCLEDMAASGVATAQIGWVAEDAIPFYSRTVGARLGRCFWMFQKSVGEG